MDSWWAVYDFGCVIYSTGSLSAIHLGNLVRPLTHWGRDKMAAIS